MSSWALWRKEAISTTSFYGFVLEAVTKGSQAGGLQEVVDSIGDAFFEAHKALHYPGFIIIQDHSTHLILVTAHTDGGSVH